MNTKGTKITKSAADDAQPRALRYVIWDSGVPGMGLRVSPTGVKTFILRYRPKGVRAPKRFLTLGRYGPTTVEEARKRATKILGQVADGKDPASELKEHNKSITVSECAEHFLIQHVLPKRKANTISLYKHLINSKVVPALGRRRLIDLTKSDVANFHHSLHDTPYIANRAVTTLAALFSWASSQGLIPTGTNPAKKLELYRETQRERYLTNDEFLRLGASLRLAETVGLPYELKKQTEKSKHAKKPEARVTVFSPYAIAAIKLLVLTGCRLREILDLRWEQVDLGRGILFLSDSKTGRKPVQLGSPAIEILNSLHKVGDFVIAGNNPKKPISGLKRPWAAVRRHAKLDGVRIHDLRHSFASVGAGAGLGLPIIGKLLGHKQSRTTSRYAHLADDPLRRATESVSVMIAQALDGSRGNKEGNLAEPAPATRKTSA